METYLAVTSIVFCLLAFIWSMNGGLNLTLKTVFIAMAVWSVYLLTHIGV